MKKAKSSIRLAKYVSDESIQVATKLAHRAAELYDAAPVHRSVVHKEKVKHANVSKLKCPITTKNQYQHKQTRKVI